MEINQYQSQMVKKSIKINRIWQFIFSSFGAILIIFNVQNNLLSMILSFTGVMLFHLYSSLSYAEGRLAELLYFLRNIIIKSINEEMKKYEAEKK